MNAVICRCRMFLLRISLFAKFKVQKAHLYSGAEISAVIHYTFILKSLKLVR
jgi:hypothetical protein